MGHTSKTLRFPLFLKGGCVWAISPSSTPPDLGKINVLKEFQDFNEIFLFPPCPPARHSFFVYIHNVFELVPHWSGTCAKGAIFDPPPNGKCTFFDSVVLLNGESCPAPWPLSRGSSIAKVAIGVTIFHCFRRWCPMEVSWISVGEHVEISLGKQRRIIDFRSDDVPVHGTRKSMHGIPRGDLGMLIFCLFSKVFSNFRNGFAIGKFIKLPWNTTCGNSEISLHL